MIKALVIIAVVLIVIVASTPVYAQGPTPTYPPVAPSPTSATEHLRSTPTMLPMGNPTPFINFGDHAGELADWTINMYRWANRDHIIDYIIFTSIALVAVGYLVSTLMNSTNSK